MRFEAQRKHNHGHYSVWFQKDVLQQITNVVNIILGLENWVDQAS